MLKLMARSAPTLLLLLVASDAFSQAVYRWVDAEGTTHYTDNAASIPKGATVFATEGEPISEMGKPAPVPLAVTSPVAAPRTDQEPSVPTSSELYWRGAFRAAKEKIRNLEDEIAADRHRVEDVNGLPVGLTYSCYPSYAGALVAPQRYGSSIVVGPQGAAAYFGPVPQQGYVAPFSSCIQTINPEYDRTRIRLEKNRSALDRAKEELHELDRRAAFDAVPLEWRR
jgi:hypothetical protein